MHTSDWRHFSDIHISQGSVATCLKHDGIFKHKFVANLLRSQLVKNFENRLIFGEVMGKSLVSCFLTHGVVKFTVIVVVVYVATSLVNRHEYNILFDVLGQ